MKGFVKLDTSRVWRGVDEVNIDQIAGKPGRKESLSEPGVQCSFSAVAAQGLRSSLDGAGGSTYSREFVEGLVLELRQSQAEAKALRLKLSEGVATVVESTKRELDKDFSLMISSCIEAHEREKLHLLACLEKAETNFRLYREQSSMTLAEIESKALERSLKSLDKKKRRKSAGYYNGVERKTLESRRELPVVTDKLGGVSVKLFKSLCDRRGRLRSSKLRHFLSQKELLRPGMVLGDVDVLIQKHSGGRQVILQEDLSLIVGELATKVLVNVDEYAECIQRLSGTLRN